MLESLEQVDFGVEALQVFAVPKHINHLHLIPGNLYPFQLIKSFVTGAYHPKIKDSNKKAEGKKKILTQIIDNLMDKSKDTLFWKRPFLKPRDTAKELVSWAQTNSITNSIKIKSNQIQSNQRKLDWIEEGTDPTVAAGGIDLDEFGVGLVCLLLLGRRAIPLLRLHFSIQSQSQSQSNVSHNDLRSGARN